VSLPIYSNFNLSLTAVTLRYSGIMTAFLAAEPGAVGFWIPEAGAMHTVFRAIATVQVFRLKIARSDLRGIIRSGRDRPVKRRMAVAIPPAYVHGFPAGRANVHEAGLLLLRFIFFFTHHLYAS
jgi:hypothetical protein